MKYFEVIKNFLPSDVIDDITEKCILNKNCNLVWCWVPASSPSQGDDDGMFSHLIVTEQDGKEVVVQDTLVHHAGFVRKGIMDFLNKELHFKRIKLNAIQKGTPTNYVMHKDVDYEVGNDHLSLILYLTDSDGPTVFKFDEKDVTVHCRYNTAVIFDSSIEHYAVRQSDAKLRVSLNAIFKTAEGFCK
jgi:hypothetical protein